MERVAVELCNALASRGEMVGICITRGPAPLAAELRREVEILELNRRSRFALPPLLRLGRAIRERRYRVLHAHGRSSFSLAAFMRALGLHALPTVYHEHHGAGSATRPPLWLKHWGRRYASAFVGVCSEQRALAVAAGIVSERFHVVPNARDLGAFSSAPPLDLRKRFQLPRDRAIALVVAAIRPDKGIDLLIDALARCCTGADLTVLVAGRTTEKEYADRCRKKALELKDTPSLRFLGEQADIATLMANADFLIMPSRVESGPLVLLEAMASGLPFAAFSVGGVSTNAAAAGISGFVPPLDTAALTAEIDDLVGDWTAGRRRDTEGAKRWVHAHHSLDEVAGMWIELYEALLTRGDRAHAGSVL